MRRLTCLAVITLFVLAAMPALAGGDHKKCSYTTQECLDKMAAKMKDTGWVGIDMDVDDATGTMTIKKVFSGSPAEAAGIQLGDVLFALNGVEFGKESKEALKKARMDWKPGQKVTYTMLRNGLEHKVDLTLAPWPADILAGYIGAHMLEHANSQIAQEKKKK